MNLLVTGGAGTLSSNLIEHWISEFKKIVVIDNFSTGKVTSLPKSSNLEVVEGNVANFNELKAAFEISKPNIVVNSAASYKNPDDWTEDANTNILGSINLAKLATEYNEPRIINFQTALCYGKPKIAPVPVDHGLDPKISYGISKVAGETYLLNSGLNVVSLRISNVTSPRLAIGPIPTFYKNLKLGKPSKASTTTRDFLDIWDFLALMDKIKSMPERNGVFHASTGVGHTILEIFQVVSRYLGHKDLQPEEILEPAADDAPVVVLDPSKTKEAFKWEAKVGFEESIYKLLNWYDHHGVDEIFSHLKRENR